MGSIWKVLLFLASAAFLASSAEKKEAAAGLMEEVTDVKEFKKILRTKTNLLVVFHEGRLPKDVDVTVSGAARATKGKGTLVKVDCKDANGKKLCKKLKVGADSQRLPVLKHFSDGEFHKDYDRPMTESSLISFILDPKGEAPWEEDPEASDVLFLRNPAGFAKALKREKGGMLVMFYAPWCGHCKRMKPDFQSAARAVKDKRGGGEMAAVDASDPVNAPLKQRFDISGFPTLLYFEGGEVKFDFEGRTEAEFLQLFESKVPRQKPEAPKKEKESEVPWSEEPSDVIHLTDGSFDEVLKEGQSMLVMFYAPWCGHCKRMKPDYVAAARQMRETGIRGTLAAVDATKERELTKRFDIKGFPTMKYFSEGEEQFDPGQLREKAALVTFMSDPKEPPPPPPPEKPWSEDEEASEVEHLGDGSFKPFLKGKKHALVMFYAPWCGHCKRAKPKYAEAARQMKGMARVKFAAVDCTQDGQLCRSQDVRGYPTFRYFSYLNKAVKDYPGGIETQDFVTFMSDPDKPQEKARNIDDEDSWSGIEGSDHVMHLRDGEFAEKLLKSEHALVMFYAPWCGHCKKAKPKFAAAAKQMKNTAKVKFATVDCTQTSQLCKSYDIRGYPTFKYFSYLNKVTKDYAGGVSTQGFVTFMSDPQKPRDGKDSWSDIEGSDYVLHLQDGNFQEKLLATEHALVMFYAPWCGHCTKAKPKFAAAAEQMKSKGGVKLATVDCTQNSQVCKSYDVQAYPTFKYFNYLNKASKDYPRGVNTQDFVTFMSDPEGIHDSGVEDSWSGIEGSDYVLHLHNGDFAEKLLESEHALVMFYAPWCGHCTKAKPKFAAAAEQMKSKTHVKFATVDCTQNAQLCKLNDVQAYPTFKYFSYLNKTAKDYPRGVNTQDFVTFMSDPEGTHDSGGEDSWSGIEGSDYVLHLHDGDFAEKLLESEHALVMFYAPWCGHCIKAKPKFAEAAEQMKSKAHVKFATVDCTQNTQLCKSYDVQAFPTFKYFNYLNKASKDYPRGVNTQDFVTFMSDPEGTPDSGGEDSWSGIEGSDYVLHLHDGDFAEQLLELEHALVMFYAPWCGHCTKAKPKFAAAAEQMKSKTHVKFATVDCTQNAQLCKLNDVRAYPTFKYFSYLNKTAKDYARGFNTQDFVSFMSDPENPPDSVAEDSWSGIEGSDHLLHLHDEDFAQKLSTSEHALVMFHAPWCGHCRKMKPDYAMAAKQISTSKALSGKSVTVAALDATREQKVASASGLNGYPTIKYFRFGKDAEEYKGSRKAQDLTDFMVKKVTGSSRAKTEL